MTSSIAAVGDIECMLRNIIVYHKPVHTIETWIDLAKSLEGGRQFHLYKRYGRPVDSL